MLYFQAANPSAVLEDFVRWYSPRDWIEEEGADPSLPPQGSLSTRMQIPGNMWREVIFFFLAFIVVVI